MGIFIRDTRDLQARNVTVRNTPGIGMVAINLMGTSDMSNVTFMNNHGNTFTLVEDCTFCMQTTTVTHPL